uniref:Uncharacterized protein n=1 Tax=Ciona savignyi TaxID=51511 RepID=H2ZEK9_CIOSA
MEYIGASILFYFTMMKYLFHHQLVTTRPVKTKIVNLHGETTTTWITKMRNSLHHPCHQIYKTNLLKRILIAIFLLW